LGVIELTVFITNKAKQADEMISQTLAGEVYIFCMYRYYTQMLPAVKVKKSSQEIKHWLA
jgi:hypothetical protein